MFKSHFIPASRRGRLASMCGALALSAGVIFTLPQTALSQSAPAATAFAHPPSFADIVEKMRPAVVSIQVDRQTQQRVIPFGNNPFSPFAPGTGRSTQRVSGTGFVISSDGYVVTNNHVIESGRRITATFPDGRERTARLVGTDPDTDIALLKLDDATNLSTVALGDDSRLRIGDWVIAVGNAFGLSGTVTAGIVSSIGRDIGAGPYTDYIQIDAPINQGNSGGPTFDTSGQVVGMNTAIFSPSGGSVGVGFAVPASTIKAIVDQLKQGGAVARGWLGLQIQDVTTDMASGFRLPEAKGAAVADIVRGSPAERAGFHQGDVVMAVNGADIATARDLTRKVGALKVGQVASFAVMRDGRRMTLSATITQREPDRLASRQE